MKLPLTLGALLLGTAAVFVGQMNSDAVAARNNFGGGTAPDVIVGDLHDEMRHGEVGGITAYSVGTTSCNIGNDYLEWQANNNNHPTIGGCMYRVVEFPNGSSRIKQIGRSWLKHGFCALQYNLCGACTNPGGSGCADRLGWNCSDPYSASLNGQQSNLGPRFEVNPTTGYFEYPPSGGSYPATIGRRLQVVTDDLHVDNARYFLEGVYIHPDDAAACNGFNNASWREVNVSSNENLSFSGSTQRMQPALQAWESVDSNVRIERVDYGDCNETFFYAVSVGDNGNGTWDYHYAVYNLNMHNSIGGFHVPHSGDVPTNVEHHLAPYHSGEPYDEGVWDEAHNLSGNLSFTTEDYAINPDAHAIHWQSMATFSFTSTFSPVEGFVEVDVHKSPDTVSLSTTVPGGAPPSDCYYADVNGSGYVDGTDLSLVLGFWGYCGSCAADVNNDGNVDGADLSFVLGYWNCVP